MFKNVVYDDGGIADTVNSRLNIRRDGNYFISVSIGGTVIDTGTWRTKAKTVDNVDLATSIKEYTASGQPQADAQGVYQLTRSQTAVSVQALNQGALSQNSSNNTGSFLQMVELL